MSDRTPCRAAYSLALAYKIERMIDAGELESYADAARRLGLSRARVTQIMDLMGLPVEVQEAVLLGGAMVSERGARRWA